MSAERPRCPGGWFAGSSQTSLPGWPASVESSDHVAPSSRLAKMPGASTPTRTRPFEAASVETFESFRSVLLSARPSLECVQVSPRSALRQTAEPCHSLAAAA